MKYRLMDILACPYDKNFPLKLYVLEEKIYEKRQFRWDKKPLCELYCEYLKKKIEELSEQPPCEECIKKEVAEGIIYCEICNRWYPIIDEIPIFLPDEIRVKRKNQDLDFLKKHKERIPETILKNGKPWTLESD
ncbi:MAG: hypothetical protein B6U95_06800 [Thermofilum sp. ex4484_82]|nr:MAG: hypothetical protein B6U95_06800 [Thermofilum sp. ex4484_82]OYT37393.1 MAG: hypothetical protein B6U96_06795 [Archaeoglobales archaeon ex4484_92]